MRPAGQPGGVGGYVPRGPPPGVSFPRGTQPPASQPPREHGQPACADLARARQSAATKPQTRPQHDKASGPEYRPLAKNPARPRRIGLAGGRSAELHAHQPKPPASQPPREHGQNRLRGSAPCSPTRSGAPRPRFTPNNTALRHPPKGTPPTRDASLPLFPGGLTGNPRPLGHTRPPRKPRKAARATGLPQGRRTRHGPPHAGREEPRVARARRYGLHTRSRDIVPNGSRGRWTHASVLTCRLYGTPAACFTPNASLTTVTKPVPNYALRSLGQSRLTGHTANAPAVDRRTRRLS